MKRTNMYIAVATALGMQPQVARAVFTSFPEYKLRVDEINNDAVRDAHTPLPNVPTYHEPYVPLKRDHRYRR